MQPLYSSSRRTVAWRPGSHSPRRPSAFATARAMSRGDAPEKPTIWRRVLMTSVGFRIAETTAVETPPQAMGVVFNAAGRVAKINVGAVMDRTSGNTAGLGGLFGFLWFVGKAPPAPEYQPYKRSWQFALLAKMAPLLTKLKGGLKSWEADSLSAR